MKPTTLKILALTFATTSTLLSGCAYNTSSYGISVENVDVIKSQNIKPIAVASFKSKTPGLDSVSCRGSGTITVKPSFEAYIEKALIDELKLAGVYDPHSELVFFGKLEEVDSSAGIQTAQWKFSLVASNKNNESFTINSSFDFPGSYVGDKACQEVAQAFSPAVQRLIRDIVQHPKFKQLVN